MSGKLLETVTKAEALRRMEQKKIELRADPKSTHKDRVVGHIIWADKELDWPGKKPLKRKANGLDSIRRN